MNYKEALNVLGGLLDAFDRDEHGDYFYEHGWEVCEATILAYGALQTQPFWIPVAERLPEKSVPVLAYKDGRIWYCERNWQSGCWESLSFAATKEYGMYWSKGPIHWMPLPEAPKEEV